MIKVTEYHRSEGAETIDVCYRISPPGAEPQEKATPIYYDDFLAWCKGNDLASSAFNLEYLNDIVSYSLLPEDAEIIIEGFLRELFQISAIETHIKGLTYSPELNRLENARIREASLITEIQLLASNLQNHFPDDETEHFGKGTSTMDRSMVYAGMVGAYKAVAQSTLDILLNIVAKYSPKNSFKMKVS